MILDTCALLWLVVGEKKLGRAVLKAIAEAHAVYFSASSGSGVDFKVARVN